MQERNAIDEDAMRTHFRCGLEQQAVRRAQFLGKHLRACEDDLDAILRLECFQIPADACGIPDELLWAGFEGYDDPRLVKFRGPVANESQPEHGFACARSAFDQNNVTFSDPAQKNFIQAFDSVFVNLLSATLPPLRRQIIRPRILRRKIAVADDAHTSPPRVS